MICEKCLREFPDTLKQPIRCFCDRKPGKHIKNDTPVVTTSSISVQKTRSGDLNLDTYHKLWQELHTYSWVSKEETEKWFAKWLIKIPCGSCKTSFYQFLQEKGFEPVFDSKEGFFEWSVKIHNRVNKKLDKKEVSVEEAFKMYSGA